MGRAQAKLDASGLLKRQSSLLRVVLLGWAGLLDLPIVEGFPFLRKVTFHGRILIITIVCTTNNNWSGALEYMYYFFFSIFF